jgi:hypothetical protein
MLLYVALLVLTLAVAALTAVLALAWILSRPQPPRFWFRVEWESGRTTEHSMVMIGEGVVLAARIKAAARVPAGAGLYTRQGARVPDDQLVNLHRVFPFFRVALSPERPIRLLPIEPSKES